jgi:hypothetical protein
MSQYVQAFNSQFEELVDDIERIFPNDAEISSASRGLKNLRRITPTLIIKVFFEYVDKPYGAYIHNNDFQYFLEKDYKEDLGNTMFSGEILSKIEVIKNPIANMNPEQQNTVLKYFQNLCNLSTLYNNSRRGLKIQP